MNTNNINMHKDDTTYNYKEEQTKLTDYLPNDPF